MTKLNEDTGNTREQGSLITLKSKIISMTLG